MSVLAIWPVAYYSTWLDPLAQAMSEYLQAVVAAAFEVQASAPIVLHSRLTLSSTCLHVTSQTIILHDCFAHAASYHYWALRDN